MSDRITIGQQVYEGVAHLFYERGMELGLGRPLTAEEALEDPIVAPMLDKVLDVVLGIDGLPS